MTAFVQSSKTRLCPTPTKARGPSSDSQDCFDATSDEDSEGMGPLKKKAQDEKCSKTEAEVSATTKGQFSAKAAVFVPQKKKAARSETHCIYYQAQDGRHLYMHSLNYRCLVSPCHCNSYTPLFMYLCKCSKSD
jgi:hypothetical protein